MIEFVIGDILQSNAEAIVNTVNCVGVMGRGIALQFKKAYPDNFEFYKAACKTNKVKPGSMFVYTTGLLTNPKYIINFPTKRHWKGKSRIEDIQSGLQDLVRVIHELGIKSIAIPPLGSGLGGLKWHTVKKEIFKTLNTLDNVVISIYEPQGAPSSEQMIHSRSIPKMTAGRAALVELIYRYLEGLLDPIVTLLEVHKLMYFMQIAGEPLRLKFQKAPYGPYSENLRHVLNAIEGYLIYGYGDGGDEPEKQLYLVPNAIDEAREYLNYHEETKKRFERVSNLVHGFESSFGLELLATVHWVLSKEKIYSVDLLVKQVHNWNNRKLKFTERQIKIACNVLVDQGWSEIIQ